MLAVGHATPLPNRDLHAREAAIQEVDRRREGGGCAPDLRPRREGAPAAAAAAVWCDVVGLQLLGRRGEHVERGKAAAAAAQQRAGMLGGRDGDGRRSQTLLQLLLLLQAGRQEGLVRSWVLLVAQWLVVGLVLAHLVLLLLLAVPATIRAGPKGGLLAKVLLMLMIAGWLDSVLTAGPPAVGSHRIQAEAGRLVPGWAGGRLALWRDRVVTAGASANGSHRIQAEAGRLGG